MCAFRQFFRVLFAVAALGSAVAATPALAHDGWDHGDHRGGHHRDWDDRRPAWEMRRPMRVYEPPPMIYLPPPRVVYVAPRPVYQPLPGFSVILSLP